MDEMNMNETTVMENENSVEVVPEENVQMIENEETSSSGSGIGLALGGVAVGAAVVYGLYKKHKAKANKTEQKPKTKKKIHLRAPWAIEETVEEAEEVDAEIVEEPSVEEE